MAEFTVFIENGKLEGTADILEAGDTDFFRDPVKQMNYFDLVRELEDPGSTQKKGKLLRLWTARPTADREMYMDAKEVPSNIFLTTDPDRAAGIARDLGRNEVRDLWKVSIYEKYLIPTLVTNRLKDYQTIGHNTVPVQRMVLVEPGE